MVAVEWVEEEMGMEEDKEVAREAAAWEAASWEERQEVVEMGEETVVVAMEAAQGVERAEAAKEAVLRVAVRGMGMVEVVLVVEQTGEALEEEVKEKVEMVAVARGEEEMVEAAMEGVGTEAVELVAERGAAVEMAVAVKVAVMAETGVEKVVEEKVGLAKEVATEGKMEVGERVEVVMEGEREVEMGAVTVEVVTEAVGKEEMKAAARVVE